MAAIGELAIANQVHIRLVDQRSRIERLPRLLASKLRSGQLRNSS